MFVAATTVQGARSIDRLREWLAVYGPDRRSVLPELEDVTPGRKRILEAGLELFARQGYPGTSIREIGAEAGVRSASLYSHFQSKEDILAELVFLGHDWHHRILVTALLESGDDPIEQLWAVMSAHVAAHCRCPKLAIVTNVELRHLSDAAVGPAAALRRQSLKLATGVVQRGMELGAFRVPQLEATITMLSSMGLGAAYQMIDRPAGLGPEEMGVVYAVLGLRMVGVDEG